MDNFKPLYSKGAVIFLFFLFVGVNLWMQFGTGGTRAIESLSGGISIPDLHFTQNRQQLAETLEAYGPQGRLFYLRYQFRDFIYPLVYASLLMALLLRFIRPKYFNIWVFVPWLAALFDYAENYYLRIIFYDFPDFNDQHIQRASIASSLKWSLVILSILLVVIAGIRRYQKEKNKELLGRK